MCSRERSKTPRQAAEMDRLEACAPQRSIEKQVTERLREVEPNYLFVGLEPTGLPVVP
jgi:hypothetical protein